jgi:hypothetical protein
MSDVVRIVLRTDDAPWAWVCSAPRSSLWLLSSGGA